MNKWFKIHCDGDWKHDDGVKLETMDNPGWILRVFIWNTNLENIEFKTIDKEVDELNFINCEIKEDFFIGYCGVDNLEEMLSIFCDLIDGKKNY
ncbi:MAG: Imm53 family immunity protein [Bacilli bacterium]